MRAIRRACDDLRRGQDEGIAMMSAIMLALILTTLSVLVLGLVLSQAMPTQFQRKSTQTVYAAEAGIETALSSVRTALGSPDYVGAVYGDVRKLPCTLQGSVATPGGELGYQVTVRYYRDNPAGQSESWLNAKKLACVPGSGTTLQPLFAYITSTGEAPTGSTLGQDDAVRTMSSIYRFNTTSTNVVGGRLYSYDTKYGRGGDGPDDQLRPGRPVRRGRRPRAVGVRQGLPPHARGLDAARPGRCAVHHGPGEQHDDRDARVPA
ncbi:hypothetical protein [Streptomyces sp. SID12501]|uniref:Type 4 fimbrial biogenesis protein PilX N-terminal domain-containing protein n=1 Tax=Streptomyces sp. SID12501 TaxID=2706042 RepID=A0A6B3C870_9ACTN|nr:hypothetical protein [Streptomyces sp. SID12501]NEC92664.1 hypothetical protein [Streptomyces sp. SID12501]